MTLEELIKEGEIIKNGLWPTDRTKKFHHPELKSYSIQDTEKYGTWKQKAIRFLATEYSKDMFIDKFKEEADKFERDNLPSEFDKALGVLKAYSCMPKTIPSKKEEPKSGNSIIVNLSNHQTQSQSQQQSIVMTIFLDTIINNLEEQQYKELQMIAAEEPEPEKAKTKIMDKIKSFGLDTTSLILSNIISNPEVWKLFLQ